MRRVALLVLGVFLALATTGAGGGCEDTGAGSSAGSGKPIVELPKDMKKITMKVEWSPSDVPVHIITHLDGNEVDHGTRRGGTFTMSGIGKSSAVIEARAAFKPTSLHCQVAVGWQYYDDWGTDRQWSCLAHWSSVTSGTAMRLRR
jgi:hypothetical protein